MLLKLMDKACKKIRANAALTVHSFLDKHIAGMEVHLRYTSKSRTGQASNPISKPLTWRGSGPRCEGRTENLAAEQDADPPTLGTMIPKMKSSRTDATIVDQVDVQAEFAPLADRPTTMK